LFPDFPRRAAGLAMCCRVSSHSVRSS
jgi:hypothetical protein